MPFSTKELNSNSKDNQKDEQFLIGFNHQQLTFAREYRGYSQTELASKINGLSQSNLSKFEKGLGALSIELIQKIIQYLNFPTTFFYEKTYSNELGHYRKRSTITKRNRLSIEQSNQLISHIVDHMSNAIEWPDYGFKSLDIEDGYTPEYIAQYTRKLLEIDSSEPIKDIYYLLESNGVIVVELDAYEKFDGVSAITKTGSPVIVINKNFSNDRKRFTLAHELGHLIMHKDFPIPTEYRDEKTVEAEADRFASEFLMPERGIKDSLWGLRLSHLADLKRYWLTSMASIIRRAKDLGCIDANKNKYLNIELSRKGWRKQEPVEVFIDHAKLFIEAYKLYRNELDYSDEELAAAFNLPIDIIKEFCNVKNRNRKLRIVL